MNNERSALLLGNEALEILKNKTVLVVGIGGVGSFCVEALARTGIGHLILVDIVMKKRIQTLNPECKVDTYDCFYDCSMDEKIFSQKIDFVIDCIDSIKSKQDLAMACIQRDIPFLSSMGTARRLDPSKLEIMELEKTSYDPIAKRMRNWKRKNKIRNKIWVVCSTEPPRPVEAGKPLPSMIFVPASAGLLLASECVKKLINK